MKRLVLLCGCVVVALTGCLDDSDDPSMEDQSAIRQLNGDVDSGNLVLSNGMFSLNSGLLKYGMKDLASAKSDFREAQTKAMVIDDPTLRRPISELVGSRIETVQVIQDYLTTDQTGPYGGVFDHFAVNDDIDKISARQAKRIAKLDDRTLDALGGDEELMSLYAPE